MEYLITGEFYFDSYDPAFNPNSERIMAEINNSIKGSDYGSGIELFTHIIRVGLSDVKTPSRQYIRKTKEIIISSDLSNGEINIKDYHEFRSEILRQFLTAIQIATRMKSSPKDFDYNKLISDIQDIEW